MLFLLFTPFYFIKSYFTLALFSLLSFSTLCLDCLSHYPPSSYGYCSYLYTKSSLCDFSLLPSLLINHFVRCNHSLEVPTTLLVVWGSTSTTSKHIQRFLFLPLRIPPQLSSISFSCVPLSPLWMIKLWVSFY